MGDPDGRLITNFQGEGFHARLFELACFAFLDAQELAVRRTHERPDFIATRDGKDLAALEVVTANSPLGQNQDIAVSALVDRTKEEIAERCHEEFAIRLATALKSKLKKRYWLLPQCRDLPLVFVVGPFHEPGSMTYIDLSVARFLYGLDRVAVTEYRGEVLLGQLPVEQHEFQGKSMPSNFFGYPSAENVSAVIYCNQWTVPRFFRMATLIDGWSPDVTGTRRGTFMLPGDPYGVHGYEYPLGKGGVPEETWWQGVTIFRNPSAKIPLPDDALKCTSAFRIREGQLEREVFDFHPLTSMMMLHREE